jgi:hypothetical protein
MQPGDLLLESTDAHDELRQAPIDVVELVVDALEAVAKETRISLSAMASIIASISMVWFQNSH